MPAAPREAARKKSGPKFSSSGKMGASKTQQAVLELGYRLITELESDSGSNITAKWMSCHLAEVMTAAETDSSRTEECVELILKIWRARQFLPSGGPFKRYGRVLSALEGILGSDPGFLNLSVPFRVRESSDEQDWASLAHSIRHHTHFSVSGRNRSRGGERRPAA